MLVPCRRTFFPSNAFMASARSFNMFHSICEKRKSKYTSRVPKSNAFVKSLRQTQTPTVFAAPQLLTSPQSQIKELVPPRLLSARQTPSFLSRRHTQRNRSTRTRAGTRPQPTNKERKQEVPVWLLFQVP